MRNPNCAFYNECLTEAAKANGPLECGFCPRFKRRPEEESVEEMEGIFDLLRAVLLEDGIVPG